MNLKLRKMWKVKLLFEICKDNKLDVNISGLEKCNIPGLDKADIYSDLEKELLNKVFTKKTIKEISDITIDENVNNVCIFIKNSKAIVLFNTDSKLVDVVVDKPIDEKSFVSLTKHFKEVVSLIETL